MTGKEMIQKMRAAQAPSEAERRDRKAEMKPRLPDRSQFVVCYDAAKKEWAGSLSMLIDGEIRSWSGTAPGVFRLLEQLDEKFRAANNHAS